MSWFRVSRGILFVAAITVPVLVLSGATSPAKGKLSPQAERGRYLVTIMGCNDCHTPGTLFGAPDFDRQLSGSEVGWSGPWGVSYPRNLSSDKETGLGAWSDQDIKTAIRTGRRPDGRVLNPPMPWQMYTALADKDVESIIAFLRTLPAVSHKVPEIVPPGQQPATPVIVFPAPGAWDAPRGATEGSDKH